MDRSTALEMARTKRPGDPEGNPEVALRGRSACSLHTSSTFSFLGNDFPSLPPVLKWAHPLGSSSSVTADTSFRWDKE